MPVTRAGSSWGSRPEHAPRVTPEEQTVPCSCFFTQVKCYHKKYRSATRDAIFRLQFHTGAVQGYGLVFGKEDLDSASKGEVSLGPWWGGGGASAGCPQAASLCFALYSPHPLQPISQFTKL